MTQTTWHAKLTITEPINSTHTDTEKNGIKMSLKDMMGLKGNKHGSSVKESLRGWRPRMVILCICSHGLEVHMKLEVHRKSKKYSDEA